MSRKISVEAVGVPQTDTGVIGIIQVLDCEDNILMLEEKRYTSQNDFLMAVRHRFLKNKRFELLQTSANESDDGAVFWLIDKNYPPK